MVEGHLRFPDDRCVDGGASPHAGRKPKANGAGAQKKLVQIAPRSSDRVAHYTRTWGTGLISPTLRNSICCARKSSTSSCLFQENRSFDFYFGTYPGARGLFSQSAAQTPGFVQPIVLTDGSVTTISPFLIPQSVTDINGQTVLLYPEDTDSVNHGHTAIDAKLDLNTNNLAQNDRYAVTEEGLSGTLSADGTTYSRTGADRAASAKGRVGCRPCGLRYGSIPVELRGPLHALRQLL